MLLQASIHLRCFREASFVSRKPALEVCVPVGVVQALWSSVSFWLISVMVLSSSQASLAVHSVGPEAPGLVAP